MNLPANKLRALVLSSQTFQVATAESVTGLSRSQPPNRARKLTDQNIIRKRLQKPARFAARYPQECHHRLQAPAGAHPSAACNPKDTTGRPPPKREPSCPNAYTASYP